MSDIKKININCIYCNESLKIVKMSRLQCTKCDMLYEIKFDFDKFHAILAKPLHYIDCEKII